MVDVEKALMAIEERDKWEEKEEKILEELKEIRKKKKELKNESKKIKKRISDCESALRSISISGKDSSEIYIDLSEQMKRM